MLISLPVTLSHTMMMCCRLQAVQTLLLQLGLADARPTKRKKQDQAEHQRLDAGTNRSQASVKQQKGCLDPTQGSQGEQEHKRDCQNTSECMQVVRGLGFRV